MAHWTLELIPGVALVVVCLLLILVIKLCSKRSRESQQRHQRRNFYQRHDQGNSSSGSGSAAGGWNSNRSIKSGGGGGGGGGAFDWKDYPALMSEATDNGWPAFAFLPIDHPHKKFKAETSWEIGNGTELMQILRSNPGLPPSEFSAQFFKSALPLPGPFLGVYSFPQAAYFEITVLGRKDPARRRENPALELVAIGLVGSVGASFSDPGSIGYFSNGQILLNGVVYTDERFKQKPWIPARGDTTVGCGFNPAQRIVFFTLNREMTCQADCSRAEEFGSPLHAGFLCNFDAAAIVNLGQSAFEFLPENARRTPDPGNHRPYPDRSRVVEYDSGELFSQRLDGSVAVSQELRRPAAPSEAESEMFEIVLDR